MTRRAGVLDLTLPPRRSGTVAYRWLYATVRAAILEGRLRPGARLPATRELARQYGLSRGTIVNAFELLRAEGYVQATAGSGTHVSQTLPDDLVRISAAKRPSISGAELRFSDYARRASYWSGTEVRPTRAFRSNIPALNLFPTTLWAQITASRLRRASMSLLIGCDPLGYDPLRAAVAEYLNTSRGARCTPEQVAIVSGIQEALDLTARLLLNPGDSVAVENPGYPGASRVFAAVGARVVPVPLDDQGLIVDASRFRNCRVVYVTPAHQFPMGTTMSLARRLALLGWARAHDSIVFEDDYDSEFRYAGSPIPALQGLDRFGRVVLAGSFNKVLFPSLRLGYLVVPPNMVDRLAAAKSLINRHASVLEQAVLCDFIAEGHFGRHLRRMRHVYAERLSGLLDAARSVLAGLLTVSSIEAGLQTVAWLQRGITGVAAMRAAAQRDVEVVPLSRYAQGRLAENGLLLGFAALDSREIRRGARELAKALENIRE